MTISELQILFIHAVIMGTFIGFVIGITISIFGKKGRHY
jgi:hypothetical protein